MKNRKTLMWMKTNDVILYVEHLLQRDFLTRKIDLADTVSDNYRFAESELSEFEFCSDGTIDRNILQSAIGVKYFSRLCECLSYFYLCKRHGFEQLLFHPDTHRHLVDSLCEYFEYTSDAYKNGLVGR
ncbi:MAG: hypothetical protein JXK07_10100 [Spirochaetes bacterium]|nr:hypothetical protein [Spirochaetota bacterium]MBN2771250.1 hypothetical protein [Spirochaetota bacterium]